MCAQNLIAESMKFLSDHGFSSDATAYKKQKFSAPTK